MNTIILEDNSEITEIVFETSGDRGPKGEAGEEILLQTNATHIQWKYVNDVNWNDLIALSELEGPQGPQGETGDSGDDGREIELQNDGTNIQWRYVGDVSWNNLVQISTLIGPEGPQGADGQDGREIELQTNATHIQWRYVGDASWNNLIALSELEGPQGVTGDDGREIELQTNATHIQWRYVGDATWNDLVSYNDLNNGVPDPTGQDAGLVPQTDGANGYDLAPGVGIHNEDPAAHVRIATGVTRRIALRDRFERSDRDLHGDQPPISAAPYQCVRPDTGEAGTGLAVISSGLSMHLGAGFGTGGTFALVTEPDPQESAYFRALVHDRGDGARAFGFVLAYVDIDNWVVAGRNIDGGLAVTQSVAGTVTELASEFQAATGPVSRVYLGPLQAVRMPRRGGFITLSAAGGTHLALNLGNFSDAQAILGNSVSVGFFGETACQMNGIEILRLQDS